MANDKDIISHLSENMKNLTQIANFLKLITQPMNQGIQTVHQLELAMQDLQRASRATAGQLSVFYASANEMARSLGVSTQSVIQAAAEWSRLGYSIQEAAAMAENTSLLTRLSPSVDASQATAGLAAAMKAFQIDAEDSLDSVVSKISKLGSAGTVSGSELLSVLSRSSAAMAEANSSLEETLALGTAATAALGDAALAGSALESISHTLSGYNEETKTYSQDLAELNAIIASLTKTSENPKGISLFSDTAAMESKSTYQLLKEISAVYDELSQKQQLDLTQALGGGQYSQAAAAILSNFSAVESSLQTLAASGGSAMQEMAAVYDSMDYKLTRLKESGTGIAQNLFGGDDMKTALDGFTAVANAIDQITEKLGLFGSLGISAGIGALIKNFGRP